MNKNYPSVSFRVPTHVIEQLIKQGKLKPDYKRTDLSNLIKNEWLAIAGQEVPISVDARVLNEVSAKIDEALELLRATSEDSR